ncbi:hypothetical protein BKA69DRAFT_335802 [Paraphysoderma sedebokerense]|nr:hypothetical protein BKA69DRAFT_335802 [Paraphysoderma sedebokerense]
MGLFYYMTSENWQKGIPCLHHPKLFASSSADGTVILWDAKGGREKRSKEFSPSSWDIPEEKHTVFRHCLHRSPVVDFEWNPYRSEKYTIASVSSDSDNVDLQGWRRQIYLGLPFISLWLTLFAVVWQIHPSLL